MKKEIEIFSIENEHPSDSLRFLNPKNKNFLDLGCGRHTDRHGKWTLPDSEYTPIFAVNRGANMVVGVDSRESEKPFFEDYFKKNLPSIENYFYTSLVENSQQVKDLISKHNIDFIKTDIEGYETLFLSWSKEDFINITDFVIEYHSNNIRNSFLEKINEWGFELYAEGKTWASGIGVLFTKKIEDEVS
jgi:hypothetical protein